MSFEDTAERTFRRFSWFLGQKPSMVSITSDGYVDFEMHDTIVASWDLLNGTEMEPGTRD